jgi:hypothetical protein
VEYALRSLRSVLPAPAMRHRITRTRRTQRLPLENVLQSSNVSPESTETLRDSKLYNHGSEYLVWLTNPVVPPILL